MIRILKNSLVALLLLALVSFTGCQTIDLFEKTADIPGHAWKSSFKPSFSFIIKDTGTLYQVYLTLRHDDKYRYNNIYINMSIQQPGDNTTYSDRLDLRLANDEKGWSYSGIGMDDIWEHSLDITPSALFSYFEEPKPYFQFKKAGTYTFTIEQIMRQDPLEHVYNVGLRLIKK